MRLSLQIDTGAGNTAKVADLGNYRPNYGAFWTLAGVPPIGDLQYAEGGSIANTYLDQAIETMRSNPIRYNGLAESVRREYDQALEYLINWRNQCKLHPSSRLTVPVDSPTTVGTTVQN